MLVASHTPSSVQKRVMNPLSPRGQAYIAVVFEGVSGQILFSGHMIRAKVKFNQYVVLQLSIGSVQTPPNAQKREILPVYPGSHSNVYVSPSYTASHPLSAEQSCLATQLLEDGVSHTPVAEQKRVCSPKNPTPQEI